MEGNDKKVGLWGLIALTVTSVVGGGIFNLMADMAQSAAVGPMIISLILSGLGMGIFVLCLENLNNKYPHLDAGIYSYAKEGFGNFVGFNSAIGYWLSIVLGNVALGSLALSALGYFIPAFGDGQTIWAVIGASVLLWIMHFTVLKGSDFASKINGIIMLAKLIPLGIFIIALLVAFNYDMFTADFWGTMNKGFDWALVGPQVKGAMISAVWVFVGVEGSIVYSARAKDKATVGKSVILSFAIITAIYLLTTVLSFAVMSQAELAELGKPAMAYVLESVVGPWGAILINIGVAISAIGCWFACIMFSGEICYQAAKEGVFPKIFEKENENKAPVNALLISNGIIQFFFLSLLVNQSAYNFMALLASSTMLVPYFFVSLSQAKLSYQSERTVSKNVILGIIATIYMGYCIYASGLEYILVTTFLFAPCMLLYILARKQNKLVVFNKIELASALIVVVLTIITIVMVMNGSIDIASM